MRTVSVLVCLALAGCTAADTGPQIPKCQSECFQDYISRIPPEDLGKQVSGAWNVCQQSCDLTFAAEAQQRKDQAATLARVQAEAKRIEAEKKKAEAAQEPAK